VTDLPAVPRSIGEEHAVGDADSLGSGEEEGKSTQLMQVTVLAMLSQPARSPTAKDVPHATHVSGRRSAMIFTGRLWPRPPHDPVLEIALVETPSPGRRVAPGRFSRAPNSHSRTRVPDTIAEVESAGGVSPPAALRTRREPLDSPGSCSPAGGEGDELPVGEEAGLVLVHLLQPGHRLGVASPESLELVHGPPGEVLVDAPC